MISSKERIALAHEYIKRAKAEENPSGNPLVAASKYLTAMEHIQSTAARIVSSLLCDKPSEAIFFLFQVKQKLAIYEERVALLLGAAREVGLEDTPLSASQSVEGIFNSAEDESVNDLLQKISLPSKSKDATHPTSGPLSM